jgi:poly(hydroxyalkanoate) depolymerase family esterase
VQRVSHRLFIPTAAQLPNVAAPLLVALHGCMQSAGDFAAGTRFDLVAEAAGAYVLYPEQSLGANVGRCWNWFLEEHQSRASGEPAAILTLVEQTLAQHRIDPERVFVAGLSAGGAMAAILAEQAPDVFSAVGIMAGVPLHASRNASTARAAMNGVLSDDKIAPLVGRSERHLPGYQRLRATIWSGANDRLVDPGNASVLAFQFLRLLGVDATRVDLEKREDAEIARWRDRGGRVRVENRRIPAMGHAWSGGSYRGSQTYPAGPRASEEMMEFFLGNEGRAPLAPVELNS